MRITLEQIDKTFLSLRGRIQALKDVSLSIEDREFFVLLGPSGCGKSTLLNMIAGLEKPSSGTICFDDQVVADGRRKYAVEPGKRNIAFVFQSYALYPHLDVFENIAFPLRIGRVEKSQLERSVLQAAERLDIRPLLRAKPGELSGGQRQRVAIARAIVRQPNIFLLDEPLSNLDARLRTVMRGELKNLQAELGITTVYVTHDQTEAMGLGHRIALFKDGQIQQVGTPEELYYKPANRFAGEFIGSPPMNFLPACVVAEKNGVSVGDTVLTLPNAHKPFLDKHNGKTVDLGVRPEHLKLDCDVNRRADGDALAATVQSFESLGRETLIHLEAAGTEILTICPGRTSVQSGQTVCLIPDLSEIHLFDA